MANYVTCPKCDGRKYIQGFSHVANGVCFRCAGNGTVKAGTVKEVKATAWQIERAEFIMNVSEETLSKMTYKQLLAARDFCHWDCPGYPTLLQVWRDKGDRFFFAAQEQKLQELYANR